LRLWAAGRIAMTDRDCASVVGRNLVEVGAWSEQLLATSRLAVEVTVGYNIGRASRTLRPITDLFYCGTYRMTSGETRPL
jgi:hypothetical protein